jgi:hypothetical protein
MWGKQRPRDAIPQKVGIRIGRYFANPSLLLALSMQSDKSCYKIY